MLTFALPTGRSLEDCIALLDAAGLPVEKLKNAGRNLIIDEANFRYLLAKPTDIPIIAANGAADLAFAGSDMIEEANIPLAQLLDTKRNLCKMSIAGPKELAEKFSGSITKLAGIRVATKYTHIAERTFSMWGVQLKLLKLNGSIELAPALGLADVIFDIVQTGTTLKANGLVVIKDIMPVSMRLVAGFGTLQTRWNKIRPAVEALKTALKEEK